MTEENEHYSTALDCFRWVAALMVVIHHARHLLLADFDEVAHKTIVTKAFYFMTGLGEEAVIVFFVLSGFLVAGGAVRKFADGRYQSRDYAIHRISRTYTVLIPALLIGGLLDAVGLTFFDGAQLYFNHKRELADATSVNMVASRLTPEAFLGNLMMLQYWLVPVFGSNAPLWTLASEWWFYCIFWTILGAASTAHSAPARIGFAALLIALVAVLPLPVLVWFTIWLIGMAVALLGRMRLRPPLWLGAALFAAAIVGVRLVRSMEWLAGVDPLLRRFLPDLVVALGFCALLLSSASIRTFRLGPAWLHRRLAGFSYTTYLVHFPMLMFMLALCNTYFGLQIGRQPTMAAAAFLLAFVATLYLYSYLFSRLAEDRTDQVRRYLSRRGASGWKAAP